MEHDDTNTIDPGAGGDRRRQPPPPTSAAWQGQGATTMRQGFLPRDWVIAPPDQPPTILQQSFQILQQASSALGMVIGGGVGFVVGGGGGLKIGSQVGRTVAASVIGAAAGDDALSRDEIFLRLRREATEVVMLEPALCTLLSKVGLLDSATLSKVPRNGMNPAIAISAIEPASSFEEVVTRIVVHRLASCTGGGDVISPAYVRHLLMESLEDEEWTEMGHTVSEAVRGDALAILVSGMGCETLLEAVLFNAGFHALVIHRVARRAWKSDTVNSNSAKNDRSNGGIIEKQTADGEKRFVALLLKSLASSAFGVDIHPASSVGAGVVIDGSSRVVVGETATIGDGTIIQNGATIIGSGRCRSKNHPKVGNNVLIGPGAKIVGSVTVGDRACIEAGSVVLHSIPSGAVAIGNPARIVRCKKEGYEPI